jgi:hypothetical protein
VVPSSVAAALTLPSRSAAAKARSPSARSVRKQPGLPAHPQLRRTRLLVGVAGYRREVSPLWLAWPQTDPSRCVCLVALRHGHFQSREALYLAMLCRP